MNGKFRFTSSFLLKLILIGVVLSVRLLPVGQGVAQAAITVQKDEVQLQFPEAITFKLAADAIGQTIDHITLIYSTSAESCVTSSARQDLKFIPAAAVDLSWTWDLYNSGAIPPGAVIRWQWEISAASGDTLTTEPHEMTVEDSHFTWKHLQQDPIILYWTMGNASFGQMLLSIATRSLARLSTEMGIPEPAHVRIMIYPSSTDLQNAALMVPEWTGGVAFPQYGVNMIGIAPDELDWAADVIPHELAHLVVSQRIANCQGADLPTWLNEGLAVYAENKASYDGEDRALADLKQGSLPALTTLQAGFPADSSLAVRAYAQSGLVVRFIYTTYGPTKVDALLGEFQTGKRIDAALQTVFGLDTAGIDQAWRASLGYGTAPVASSASPTPIASTPTRIPTIPLYGGLETPTPTASPSPLPSATPLPSTPTPTVTATARATPTLLPSPSSTPAPTQSSSSIIWLCAGAMFLILILLSLFLLLAAFLFLMLRFVLPLLIPKGPPQ